MNTFYLKLCILTIDLFLVKIKTSPRGETDIMSAFGAEVPGSNPGEGTNFVILRISLLEHRDPSLFFSGFNELSLTFNELSLTFNELSLTFNGVAERSSALSQNSALLQSFALLLRKIFPEEWIILDPDR